MDTPNEVSDAIKEVQTSNRFILKRLNQIVNGPSSCTCSCLSSNANTELQILNQRLQDYEEVTKQRDTEVQSLRAELQELKSLFNNGQISDNPHLLKIGESFNIEVRVKSLHPPDIYSYHASSKHTFSETRDSDKEPENAAEKKWAINQSEKATNADKGERYGFDSAKDELLDEGRKTANSQRDVNNQSETRTVTVIHTDKSGDLVNDQPTHDEHSGIKKVRFRRTPVKEDGMQEKEGTHTGRTVTALTGTLREVDKDNSNCTNDDRELPIDYKRGSDPINKQDIENGHDDRKHANKVHVADDSNQGKETMTTSDEDVGEAHGTSQDKRENDAKAKAKQDVPETRKDSVKENVNGARDKKHIVKANFKKRSIPEICGARIVEQTEKRTIKITDWHMAASREQVQGHMRALANLEAAFTIVLVDISYSMTQGNAWEQAKTFFNDFMEGLKETMSRFRKTEEHVALVTFGHKTEVLKRLTNDFTSLQMSFDGLSLGGPSPMYGGLCLALAVAQTASNAKVNGIPVATKLVIITDGFLTDTNLVAGPDILTPSEQDDTYARVLGVMQFIRDVFFVPVGNANMEFLQSMQTVSDGKMLTYKDGKRLGTRLRKAAFLNNQVKDTITRADDDVNDNVGEAHGTSQDRGENEEVAKAKQDVPESRKDYVKENFNGTGDKKHTVKADFKKKSLSERVGARIVEQTEKRTIKSTDWLMAGRREQLQGQMSGLDTLEGVLFTIVLVDISYSMTQGNAWEQAKTFFNDFIEGLKESMSRFDIIEESVALVTFGHKTEVLKRLTNDFTSLQMSFDGISLGGPSPMYGGLVLSLAAAQTASSPGGAMMNGIPVATKFVIITDGFLTDTNLVAGPDILTPSEQAETHAKVLEVMQLMKRHEFDVFFVPVGNANMEFLQLMRTVSDGKILTFKNGKRLGTRLRKALMAGGGRLLNILTRRHGHRTTESDEEDIKDILESAEKRSKHKVDNQYRDSDNRTLPAIGSRVRRGPDWRWDNQDSNGPGTVIGHAENDLTPQIWIEWDNNGKTNVNNYDASDGYGVLIVDEPRLPKPNGQLAVGCVVKPGKHWKQTTEYFKVPDTSRGAVIKILDDEKVKVRWENKERGEYSAGLNGQFEVEFWDFHNDSLKCCNQLCKCLFDNGQTSDNPHFSKIGESLPLFKNEVSVKSLHPPDIYSYHASIEHTFSETRDSDKEPENAAEKKWAVHQSEKATNADKGGRHESDSVKEELLDEARQKTEDEHSTKKKVRFRRTPDKEDGMQEKEGPDTGKTVTGTLREMDKDNSDISTSDFRELSIDFKRESDPINKRDIDNEHDDRKHANEVQVADDSNQGKDTIRTADDDVVEAHGSSQDRGENDEEAKAKQDVQEKRKDSVKENLNGASDKKHIAKANFQKKSLSESLGGKLTLPK